MEKRGFTLVEVMAVLVILCLIMLMGVPSITKTIKKQEDKAVKQYENTLCMAAKNYARHDTKKYEFLFETENGGEIRICSKELYENGYISDTLRNPDGKKDPNVGIMLSRDTNENNDIEENTIICQIKYDDEC